MATRHFHGPRAGNSGRMHHVRLASTSDLQGQEIHLPHRAPRRPSPLYRLGWPAITDPVHSLGDGLQLRYWTDLYPRERRPTLSKPGELLSRAEAARPHPGRPGYCACQPRRGGRTRDGPRREAQVLWLPRNSCIRGKPTYLGRHDARGAMRALSRGAEKHVEWATKGESPLVLMKDLSKLSTEQVTDFCGQCHRTLGD